MDSNIHTVIVVAFGGSRDMAKEFVKTVTRPQAFRVKDMASSILARCYLGLVPDILAYSRPFSSFVSLQQHVNG